MSEQRIVAALSERGLSTMLEEVARSHHVTQGEVVGRTRRLTPTKARHELWRRLRDEHGFSYPEIGSLFDRDHTTIMAGIRNARARQLENPS